MTSETPTTKAELATLYAGRGWRVFPIAAGTKDRPLVKWGREATSDAAIVARWWQRTPDANIGLAVGPSGLAIVDLDDKPSRVKGKPPKEGSKRWAELEFEHGEAPSTLKVRTPSGGTHLYFRGTVRNSVDRLAEGVDTRGSGGMGGYVLAAGSSLGAGDQEKFYTVVAEAPIADLPEWVPPLIGAATAKQEHQGKVDVRELDAPWAIEWAQNHLSVDCKVAVAGEGGNNTAFRVACECRDKGLSRDTIAAMMIDLYNPRCDPPWTDEEIETFATNAWNYGDVVAAGGDTPEAHFGGADDFGKAGPPPSIDEFHEMGARPLAEGRPGDKTERPETSGEDTSSRSFRDDWVWIVQQYMFMRRRDKFTMSVPSFDSTFGYLGEKGKVTPMILQGNGVMPKFETIAFLPGEPEMGGQQYNTWTQPRLQPKEGDTSIFHEHMERLLPDEAERDAALDWMAWVLQNEKLKPNFMFLMQGEQGCGKSWLGILMSLMIDERNTTFLRTEDVGNRFNSWIIKTRLAVVEELMGDDKRTLANRMKALITQDTVSVELKGKDLITMPNKACFMAFTNHLDALKLENSDRRYMVFSTKAKGLGTPIEYWDQLWAFAGPLSSDDGPAAVMHELLVRRVDRRFGLGRAPHTKAHDTMRREGLPELERWMIENFEDGNPPFNSDLVCVTDIETHLPPRMQRMNGLHKIIPAFLRDELKATNLGAHRIPGLPQKRLWAVRRAELYGQMKPADRVTRYLKSGLGSIVGDDFNDDVDVMADNLDDPLA